MQIETAEDHFQICKYCSAQSKYLTFIFTLICLFCHNGGPLVSFEECYVFMWGFCCFI